MRLRSKLCVYSPGYAAYYCISYCIYDTGNANITST